MYDGLGLLQNAKCEMAKWDFKGEGKMILGSWMVLHVTTLHCNAISKSPKVADYKSSYTPNCQYMNYKGIYIESASERSAT